MILYELLHFISILSGFIAVWMMIALSLAIICGLINHFIISLNFVLTQWVIFGIAFIFTCKYTEFDSPYSKFRK